MQPETPALFAVNELVVPKYDDLPAKYADRAHWTGYWIIPKDEQLQVWRCDEWRDGRCDGRSDGRCNGVIGYWIIPESE